jgi:hypothetical protein
MIGRGSSTLARMLDILELFSEKDPFWWIAAPDDDAQETSKSKGNHSLLPGTSTKPTNSWPIADPFGMPW